MKRWHWAACIVFLTAVSLALLRLTTLSDAQRYRWFQSEDALYRVLYTQASNGMLVTDLERLLGPASRDLDQARWRKMMSKLIDKHPHEFPDGLEEGDEWIEYQTGIISQPIQVRDGRLVNFKPSAYAEPPQVQLIQ
jgi:hypothetical protein